MPKLTTAKEKQYGTTAFALVARIAAQADRPKVRKVTRIRAARDIAQIMTEYADELES